MVSEDNVSEDLAIPSVVTLHSHIGWKVVIKNMNREYVDITARAQWNTYLFHRANDKIIIIEQITAEFLSTGILLCCFVEWRTCAQPCVYLRTGTYMIIILD